MHEFVEFLAGQSPYDRLDADDLETLARRVDVEFFPNATWIIVEGGPTLDRLFVVRTGSVGVLDRGRVVDVLYPGDTFGHISVLSGLPPALGVRALEDTLCYSLPDPRGLLSHPEQLQFRHFNSMVARERLIEAGGLNSRFERPISVATRPAEWCLPSDSIRDVAVRLTESRETALLVRVRDSFGIVTDDDFRRDVATGHVNIDAPISAIASVPAISVPEDTTVWSTYLEMVDRGIHHMVVTGNDDVPVGVAGLMEIIGSDIHHPLVVRSAIASARTLPELGDATALIPQTLVELWDADVSSRQLGAVRTAVVEAAFRRVLEVGSAAATLPGNARSWLLLGSTARRESMPGSDVDTAFVWRDDPPVDAEATRAAVQAVLREVTEIGFGLCPNDANASHPLFGRPLSDWQRAIGEWVADPAEPGFLILASAMLDGRPMTRPRLGDEVTSALLTGLRDEGFMRAMLRFALTEKPPAGFVREFVIERFGERRGELDLKRAAIRPIVSLARALALRVGNVSGSTEDRLERAAADGLLSSEEAETLTGAFLLAYDLLIEEEIDALRRGTTSTSFIAPAQLDPLKRRHLRSAFRAIERIQDRVGAERHLLPA